MAEPTFFDVVCSQRGVRLYKPDPVPQEAIDRMLRAAVRAPSAGNRQNWAFIVIRDPETKRKLGELYLKGQARARGGQPGGAPPPSPPGHFARDMELVPVVIMACIANGGEKVLDAASSASIYPAVQNLMLAAAALGLGTRLTTIWQHAGDEVDALLGIPDDYTAMALVPVGYPAEPDHLGGSLRKPVAEVTFYDRWGQWEPAS